MATRKVSHPMKSGGQAESVFAHEIHGFMSFCRLSKRESDIVLALIRNITHSEEIGNMLGISTHTVNNHLKSIFEKTGTKSKTEILALFVSFAAEGLAQKHRLLHRTSVLIVDPDQTACEQLSTKLVDKGFRAFSLTDAKRMQEYVGKYPIDFILCSLELGNTDGMTALRSLRRTNPCWPQFILCTPAKQSQISWSLEEAFHEGASGVLAQPFDTELLVKTITSQMLDQGTFNEATDDMPLPIDQSSLPMEVQLGFGGAFIPLETQAEILAQLGIGSTVDLKLSTDHALGEPFKVRGQVVWKRSTENRGLRSGVGVRFVAMTEKDGKIFERYLLTRDITSYIPIGRIEDEGGKLYGIPRKMPFTGS